MILYIGKKRFPIIIDEADHGRLVELRLVVTSTTSDGVKRSYVSCIIDGAKTSLAKHLINYCGKHPVVFVNGDPTDYRKSNLRVSQKAAPGCACSRCGLLYKRDGNNTRCKPCRDFCDQCDSPGVYRRGKCKPCHTSNVRQLRETAQEHPVTKVCSKCQREFTNVKIWNSVCAECSSLRSERQWAEKSDKYKELRRSDAHRSKQKAYHQKNRERNEATLFERFSVDGSYQCKVCDYRSSVKRSFSLHHVDANKKTGVFSQFLRRGSFEDKLRTEDVILLCQNCHSGNHYGDSYLLDVSTQAGRSKQRSLTENALALLDCGLVEKCYACQKPTTIKSLEFHHKDPLLKEHAISTLVRKASFKELMNEMTKCVPLCSNCHRKLDAGLNVPFAEPLWPNLPQLSGLKIEVNAKAARSYLIERHYTNSAPVSSRLGLVVKWGDTVVGALLMSQCSRQNVAQKYGGGVIELSRMYLSRVTPANTASWLIGHAVRWAKRSGFKSVLSYAASHEGHVGTVYKASNFKEVGRTKPNYFYMDHSGKRVHKKQVWGKRGSLTEREYAESLGLRRVDEPFKRIFTFSLI